MRLSQLILLLLITNAICAQTPAGLANTFELSETVGFSGRQYTHFFAHTRSGKVYTKDQFGGVYVIGNNTSRPLVGYKKFIDNGGSINEVGEEIWIDDGNHRIIIIKDDSVLRVVKAAEKEYILGRSLGTQHYGNRLFSFHAVKGRLEIYEFKKQAWIRIVRAPFPPNIKFENIKIVYKSVGFVLGVLDLKDIRHIYKVDTSRSQLQYIKSISETETGYFFDLFNGNWENYARLKKSFDNFFSEKRGKPLSDSFWNWEVSGGYLNKIAEDRGFIFARSKVTPEFLIINDGIIKSTIPFEINAPKRVIKNPYYPCYTVLTGSKAYRVFPYVKKYPRIYDEDNSNSIFTTIQDDKGRIWAGSYNKTLSIIDSNGQVIPLKRQSYAFMDAAINYNGKIYLVGETENGGVLQYNMRGSMRKLLPQLTVGYYLYHAPKSGKIYFPSAESPDLPVYYCNATELEKDIIRWEKLDKKVGIDPISFRTVTEDTLGRIWMGHPQKGFAVYNPKSKIGATYDTRKQQSPIGFMSSLTDKNGTVWMGSSDQGLWYYNDYDKPATPGNIQRLNHPLLNKAKFITAMTIYNNWLILSCYDKICLLDLDAFYKKGKIVVRYLNQQEAALSSYTEQNTMLTSKTDSTIWFSTNDMLYQWDIKTWLKLPQYKADVAAFLQHDASRRLLDPKNDISLNAGLNSFDLMFEYLSPDGLPRFMRAAFIKNGDKLVFNEPGNIGQFTFKNLTSGAYTFYVEVFEQDGTTSRYTYRIVIRDFFWKQWWFWAVCSLIVITPVLLWFNVRRKKALMEKEISQLNVITLSGQFRPHFILNALNTIGADLKDKPLAESIISRLGESINLIFNQSQQKVVCHSLKNEWRLVENVIQIHCIMYLPTLEITYLGGELINEYEELNVPLGILETNVENALLHGLRNKRNPPYSLSISVSLDDDYFYFEIRDNGIGRKAATKISSYKKHGTGIKNLNAIIDILNKFNKHKISISFLDNQKEGTVVNIKIPKEYRYKY